MLSGPLARVAFLPSLALAMHLFAPQAVAQADPPQKSSPPEPAEFSAWLLQVQYCHRLDRAPDTARRIAELQAQRDAAATPAERRKVEREIDQAEADGEKTRPHVIYGWCVETDDAGKPVDSTRSMTGFILAATAENDKALAAARQAHERGRPAVIAFSREGAVELFSYAGRRWRRVDRAVAVARPPDLGEPMPFDIPPRRPITEQERRAFTISLHHERSGDDESGSSLHRWMLHIRCTQPPAKAKRLRVWIAAGIEIDGEVYRPIIDDVDLSKTADGAFAISRSFEVIAHGGGRLNPDATTAEALAIAWE